jgi:hypothetical protein
VIDAAVAAMGFVAPMIVKVENLIEHQDVELEVARKQLDAMVPALMTLSKQMTERPAAETRAEDPPPAFFALPFRESTAR